MQYGVKMLRDLQQAALWLDPYQLQEETKSKQNDNTAYMVNKEKRKKDLKKGRKFPSELIC